MTRLGTLLVLLLVPFAAAAEFAISTPERLGVPAYPRWSVKLSGPLVVWFDARPYEPSDVTGQFIGSIRGRFLDADRDFAIARDAMSGNVFLATDGRDLLVAYDARDGRARLVRVTAAGHVKEVATLRGRARALVPFQGNFAVLTSNFIETWLHVADSDGNLLVRETPLVRDASVPMAVVTNTRDGGLFFVYRDAQPRSRSAFLTAGEIFAPQFAGITTTVAELDAYSFLDALAEGEDGFLLAAGDPFLVTVAFDRAGQMLRETRHEAIEQNHSSVDSVVVAKNGTGYSVVTARFAPELTTRLRTDREGRAIAYEPVADSARGVGADGSRLALAHDDGVAIAELPAGGPVRQLGPRDVAMSLPSQEGASSIRCHGIDYVAWVDREHTPFPLHHRRFRDGTPLDPPNLTLDQHALGATSTRLVCGNATVLLQWSGRRGSGAAFLGDAPRPLPNGVLAGRATFDGTAYIDVTPAMATRWSESGVKLAEAPLSLDAEVRDLDVASNGRETLIAWNGSAVAWNSPALKALRLDRELRPIGSIVELEPATLAARRGPVVASSPDGWLVAWLRHEFLATSHELRTLRIASDGTPLDPPGGIRHAFVELSITPRVTWNGTAYEILARNVVALHTPRGAVATRILSEPNLIALNGSHFLVYWRVDEPSATRRLFGTFVDPATFTISPAPRRRAARH